VVMDNFHRHGRAGLTVLQHAGGGQRPVVTSGNGRAAGDASVLRGKLI
jgi:hypothetical protein